MKKEKDKFLFQIVAYTVPKNYLQILKLEAEKAQKSLYEKASKEYSLSIKKEISEEKCTEEKLLQAYFKKAQKSL